MTIMGLLTNDIKPAIGIKLIGTMGNSWTCLEPQIAFEKWKNNHLGYSPLWDKPRECKKIVQCIQQDVGSGK